MIVVTHEMGFAREVADSIIFFDEGNIVEAAPPKFFTSPEHERTLGADSSDLEAYLWALFHRYGLSDGRTAESD